MNRNSFIYGSLILAIANFVVRIIGFSYRIILSKLIGPEGIGLFQMVFPVLMFFVTITTAGIPIAVSRLVSKQKTLSKHNEVNIIFKVALFITISISILLVLIILALGKHITYNLLNNDKLIYLVYSLAPAILIISISSVARGYFYGLKEISPAGISQIIEQLTRVILVIGFLYWIYPIDSSTGALIAVLGISIGELSGLLWLLYKYKSLSRKIKLKISFAKINYLEVLSEIFVIALPITISRLINVSLQMVNAIIIPQRLMIAGYSNSEAVSIFGRIMGMSMPLIFLPFIFTSALAVNIIPNLSGDIELKKYDLARHKILLAIKTTLLISIPLTAIYIFYSRPIAMILYNDSKVGEYIGILGYTTIFLSLQHTLSGILHGLGKQITATINYIIGMIIQLLCTYYLVANASIGINGFFIGFIAAAVVISFLNLFSVNRAIKIRLKFNDLLFKPILATSIMIITSLLTYKHLNTINQKEFLSIIISTVNGGIMYLLILFITGGLPLYIIKKIIKSGLF